VEPARIRIEPALSEGDRIILGARLDQPAQPPQRLWWSLPAAWAEDVTPWSDPFVVGLVFPMMRAGRDVVVEGRVSPSLLEELETFMAIWHAWRGDLYRPVAIRGAEESEPPAPAEPGQTVMPFSCGVDSCFTLYRHRQGLAGRRNRRIAAGVVMNGFDIWLDQDGAPGMYAGLLDSAAALLESQHAACIPMASNFHELPTVWGDSHGTHLVSGLRLLAGRFDSALIPSTTTYSWLARAWGSHPVSDRHLSSRTFRVADDGAELHRPQKAKVIAQWPEAMRLLRVCSENPASAANCCRCEKCIRTILSFRAAGCQLPAAFARDVTDRQVGRVRLRTQAHVVRWQHILQAARAAGLGRTGWARAIRTAIRRSRRRWVLDRLRRPFVPVRNLVRLLVRGSSLSRGQLTKAARGAQGPASRS